MRSLLDVNFLIALLDPKHTFHDRAHLWWSKNDNVSWASCPLTENGLVRIMANPRYDSSRRFSIRELFVQFKEFVRSTDHEFWHDDISLRNESIIDVASILGPGQLTDIYLLALAVNNKGRLVTLDGKITPTAVRSAKPYNLLVI